MKFWINIIFWPLMCFAIVTDGYANGFRTSMVFPSMATLLWMLGFCVAMSGPLFGYFADDDWVVKSISIVITAASFGVSILSGYGALGAEQNALSGKYERKVWLTEEIQDFKYTEDGLDKCWKEPGGRCVVKEVKADLAKYQEELKDLSAVNSPLLSHNEKLLSWGIMIFLALSPLISLGCSLILAKVQPPIQKKKLA